MSHPPAVYRRRRVTALAVLAAAVVAVVLVITLLTGFDAAERPAATATRTRAGRRRRQGQGRTAARRAPDLPENRVVAFYGAPQDKELGALGIGSPAAAARKLERQAERYARKSRPVIPAMELIAVVAAPTRGRTAATTCASRTRSSGAT